MDIDSDFIERVKSQDSRFQDIELSIKIEAELRDSIILKAVLKTIENDANQALKQLAIIDPTDVKGIIALQSKVYCATIIGNTIESIREAGAFAMLSVQEESITVDDDN